MSAKSSGEPRCRTKPPMQRQTVISALTDPGSHIRVAVKFVRMQLLVVPIFEQSPSLTVESTALLKMV